MKLINKSKFHDYYDNLFRGDDDSLIFVREQNEYKLEDPKLDHMIWELENYVGLLKTNPSLKELDFYKIKDVYQTFQELEMFLGGVLTNDVKLLEPTDEEKLNIHGFNDKSFKQVSPGKKFRRRNHV